MDEFTFTWHIENFSMCPKKKGQYLSSPPFVVDVLGKTTWLLRLYPKGTTSTDGDWVSCFLHWVDKGEEAEEMVLRFAIKEVHHDRNTSFRILNDSPFKKSGSLGYNKWISLQTLRENKRHILPNDVLTLICFMKRGMEQSDESRTFNSSLFCSTDRSLQEDSILISDENMLTEQLINHCYSRMRIPVHSKKITWNIKNFKTKMKSGKKIPASVVSNLREKSELLLSCYMRGDWDSDGTVMIDIRVRDRDFLQIFVRCKATAINKDNLKLTSIEEDHLFRKNSEVWSLPLIIERNTIENCIYDLLNDDSLTLLCEFLLSYEGEEITVDGSNFPTNTSIGNEDLKQDLTNMLISKEFDVTLISEELEIPVHKSVICARSPVFKAMFTNETEEKRTGVVRITDIDADTLKNMKKFMYEDHLPELQPESTLKLYVAANKYQFLKLKKQCVASLTYSLSVSNVCDVLILADLHQDAELLKNIYNFLRGNSQVFQSSEWMNMMENNFELAGETMRKLLVKLLSS